jgi:tetratricopeptide (TPR) repeat protein
MFLLIFVFSGLGWSFFIKPDLFFWLTFALLFYVPVANVIPLTYLAADRYLYAPWAAIAIMLVWGLSKLVPTEKALVISVIIVFIPLGILTWKQNQVWKDRVTLWTHAFEVNPQSSFVINNVGNIEFDKGNIAEAAKYYHKALKTNPLNPASWYNLGNVYDRYRNLNLSLQFYQQFINLNHPAWKREVGQTQQYLRQNYGITLTPGKFDPSLAGR